MTSIAKWAVTIIISVGEEGGEKIPASDIEDKLYDLPMDIVDIQDCKWGWAGVINVDALIYGIVDYAPACSMEPPYYEERKDLEEADIIKAFEDMPQLSICVCFGDRAL